MKGGLHRGGSADRWKLEMAERGMVFLDEIGDMNPFAQAKMLRAIERREVHRLGGRQAAPLNLRIIAATNQDLESLVRQGAFRKDP
jgi:transcriptional regulator with PAS, ATPase and Fis domain